MRADRENGVPQAAYSAPAVDKAFEILDLIAGENGGLTVTDIATRLGRSTSQIYRIVVALHRLGYILRHEDSDRYALSLKLFELSTRHPPLERLIFHANPVLERLAAEIDQSCHVAKVSGRSLIIIAQADSPMPMHYTVKLGSRFPAMETSSGVSIAAFLPEARQNDLLEEFSAAEQRRFRSRFDAVRANGFEERESDVTAGVINLAVPILDAADRPLAAMTCLFQPQKRMRASLDDARRAVKAAGRELTAVMRGS